MKVDQLITFTSRELHSLVYTPRNCKIAEERQASYCTAARCQTWRKLSLALPFSALKATVQVKYFAGVKSVYIIKPCNCSNKYSCHFSSKAFRPLSVRMKPCSTHSQQTLWSLNTQRLEVLVNWSWKSVVPKEKNSPVTEARPKPWISTLTALCYSRAQWHRFLLEAWSLLTNSSLQLSCHILLHT